MYLLIYIFILFDFLCFSPIALIVTLVRNKQQKRNNYSCDLELRVKITESGMNGETPDVFSYFHLTQFSTARFMEENRIGPPAPQRFLFVISIIFLRKQ